MRPQDSCDTQAARGAASGATQAPPPGIAACGQTAAALPAHPRLAGPAAATDSHLSHALAGSSSNSSCSGQPYAARHAPTRRAAQTSSYTLWGQMLTGSSMTAQPPTPACASSCSSWPMSMVAWPCRRQSSPVTRFCRRAWSGPYRLNVAALTIRPLAETQGSQQRQAPRACRGPFLVKAGCGEGRDQACDCKVCGRLQGRRHQAHRRDPLARDPPPAQLQPERVLKQLLQRLCEGSVGLQEVGHVQSRFQRLLGHAAEAGSRRAAGLRLAPGLRDGCCHQHRRHACVRAEPPTLLAHRML
jgi:hypothetical protein